jgi:hypothetical protein
MQRYRVGDRKKDVRKQRRRLLAACIGIILLVIVSGLIAHKYLRSNTFIHKAAVVVTTVKVATPATKIFRSGIFTIQLPISWQAIADETQPYTIYRFEGNVGGSDEQLLEIYQDTIPQNFAVNHVLAVSSNGDQLSAVGTVSDNCADFTKASPSVIGSAGTPAKWSGINFLCDLNNTSRDVVGTSSADGINAVILVGPTEGKHSFFFCYTDNSISPDYTDLYSALDSFRVK